MRGMVNVGFWLFLLLQKNANGQHLSRVESGIVGGHEVVPHTFPWQARLYLNKNPPRIHCGGTIICPKFILTAGHCTDQSLDPVNGFNVREWSVMVGDHAMSEKESSQRSHKIKKAYHHEKYQLFGGGSYAVYDYALLELWTPIRFTKEVQPVFLPKENDDLQSSPLLVASGWGMTENFQASDVLKSVILPWVRDRVCEEKMDGIFSKQCMVCAGGTKRENSICNGDSGGPLVWRDAQTNEIKVVGISSFVDKQCSIHPPPYSPQVFADVQKGLEWINGVTRDCNSKTCGDGKCMTEDKLHHSVAEMFDP